MYSLESVPFLDLVTPHEELKEELTAVFQKALSTASFIGGAMVEDFEKDFAEFCGVQHAVAVSSGTDALRFALMAAGVKAGEVVVTVPHTFIATTEAISQSGAIPEFVDIDESTYNMSVERLREYVETKCTRDRQGRLISRKYSKLVTAIVPVHLYGQMTDMDGILQIAEENQLTVIEDACQAHGAEYFSQRYNRWMTAGSMGRAAAFSFYPGKNLGACGEAGAIVTNDGAIDAITRRLRDHGQTKKYHHEIEGYNGRLDAIQAGLLHVKLGYLQQWNNARRSRAAEYNRMLASNKAVICPYEPAWSKAVYHLYVIRTRDRDRMICHLNEVGVGTGIHYPVPLHLQRAYAGLGYTPDDFPVSTRVAKEILSLPMFPQLTAAQLARVVSQIQSFTEGSELAPEKALEASFAAARANA